MQHLLKNIDAWIKKNVVLGLLLKKTIICYFVSMTKFHIPQLLMHFWSSILKKLKLRFLF